MDGTLESIYKFISISRHVLFVDIRIRLNIKAKYIEKLVKSVGSLLLIFESLNVGDLNRYRSGY